MTLLPREARVVTVRTGNGSGMLGRVQELERATGAGAGTVGLERRSRNGEQANRHLFTLPLSLLERERTSGTGADIGCGNDELRLQNT